MANSCGAPMACRVRLGPPRSQGIAFLLAGFMSSRSTAISSRGLGGRRGRQQIVMGSLRRLEMSLIRSKRARVLEHAEEHDGN